MTLTLTLTSEGKAKTAKSWRGAESRRDATARLESWRRTGLGFFFSCVTDVDVGFIASNVSSDADVDVDVC